MTTKDYIKRATDILDSFNKKGNSEDVYNDLMREFKHLVYRYDSSLPLFKELDAMSPICIYSFDINDIEEVKQYRKYIEFFIHYLEEYDNN